MTLDHNQLANDLASHLRGLTDRVVWTDMQLGPSGSPRPDVYTIPKSFSKFLPLAYEVKISVADFRKDVTSGKWQSYLKFASGVIFAVPAGLITKADVPLGCGLIVRHDEIWRSAKGPTLKVTENLPRDTWIKLMIDGLERQIDNQRFEKGVYSAHQKIAKKYGDELGRALSDLDQARLFLNNKRKAADREMEELENYERERTKHARTRAEAEIKAISNLKDEFCKTLGLPSTASQWEIQSAIIDASRRVQEASEVKRLSGHLKDIKEAFESALKPLPALKDDLC